MFNIIHIQGNLYLLKLGILVMCEIDIGEWGISGDRSVSMAVSTVMWHRLRYNNIYLMYTYI